MKERSRRSSSSTKPKASRKQLLLALLLLVPIGFVGWQVSLYAWSAYHWRTARQAIARRHFPEAQHHLDKCLLVSPTDGATLLLAAQTARRAGDTGAAKKLLDRAAQSPDVVPEAVDLEQRLQRLQAGELPPRDAEAVYRYCLNNPDEPEAQLMLEALVVGSLQTMSLGRAKQGIDLWLEHHSATPQDRAQGLIWQGDLALRRGDRDAAQAEYRAALDLDAESEPARRRLAEVLVRYAPQEALQHLEQLQKRRRPGQEEDDPEMKLLLARCRRALGEPDRARELLDALLAEQPAYTDGLLERGHVALDLRRLDQAERYFRQAESLAPQRRDTVLALRDCLQQAGKDAEAKKYQQRLKEIDEEIQRRIDQLFNAKKKKKDS